MKSLLVLVLVLVSGSAFATYKAKPAPAVKPAPPVPGICRITANGNKSILDAQKRAKCPPVVAKPVKAAKKK